jgi:hypothetical protein
VKVTLHILYCTSDFVVNCGSDLCVEETLTQQLATLPSVVTKYIYILAYEGRKAPRYGFFPFSEPFVIYYSINCFAVKTPSIY